MKIYFYYNYYQDFQSSRNLTFFSRFRLLSFCGYVFFCTFAALNILLKLIMLVGRKQEQQELRRLYASDEAELVVVYGRRRVGKTYLVNHVFDEEEFVFKVTGLHNVRLAAHLDNFVRALREYSGDDSWTLPSGWMEAFDQLKTYLKNTKTGRKRVLFIDELPWMDTRGSHFMEAFEWFWNSW